MYNKVLLVGYETQAKKLKCIYQRWNDVKKKVVLFFILHSFILFAFLKEVVTQGYVGEEHAGKKDPTIDNWSRSWFLNYFWQKVT